MFNAKRKLICKLSCNITIFSNNLLQLKNSRTKDKDEQPNTAIYKKDLKYLLKTLKIIQQHRKERECQYSINEASKWILRLATGSGRHNGAIRPIFVEDSAI